MKERREGLESINNDIAAAAFATDMAELESDDAIKDLVKVAEEERIRGQEYINWSGEDFELSHTSLNFVRKTQVD